MSHPPQPHNTSAHLSRVRRYFRTVLYREGIMDVSTNSIKGKKYRFTSSSQCFKSVAEFLYTGQIRGAAPEMW